MNAHSLEQIATALERIETHLADIVLLLAHQQGVAMTVRPNGRTVIGDVHPGHTQAASR